MLCCAFSRSLSMKRFFQILCTKRNIEYDGPSETRNIGGRICNLRIQMEPCDDVMEPSFCDVMTDRENWNHYFVLAVTK